MISLMLTALSEMLRSFFELKTTQTTHESETEIIEDKHDLEKACLHAELAISCAEKYKLGFSKLDRASFIRHTRKFRKYK